MQNVQDPFYFPFPVPDTRFDQRNEMFKRAREDEAFAEAASRFYDQTKYQDKYGFRKLDFALRNASWHIEHGFAFGVLGSDHGMYSWDHVSERDKRFLEVGDAVSYSPEVNAHIVKKAARFLGADLVGICYAHPNLIYSHSMDLIDHEHRPLELPAGCTHAIVMAVEMDYQSSRYSPDAIAGASTGLGYSTQAMVASMVAAFIRQLGFRAVPCGNDTALSIPLALAAGLGELGRNGLLITEKYGPRVRICKVFTDMPLAHDDYRPIGVHQFCRSCMKCAEQCPSQSIPYDEPTLEGPSAVSNHVGVRKWYTNPETCFLYWARNMMDCNNCVAVCPFNKPAEGALHNLVRFLVKRTALFNRLMVWADNLMGYGEPIRGRDKDFWEK